MAAPSKTVASESIEAWRARADQVLPGGTFGNTAADIIIRNGLGSRVWDADGVEYIDYLIGSGPGQLLFGAISDRFGRRPVLLFGLIIYTLASLLAVLAPSYELLRLARTMQGIGASAPRTVMIASVRDLFVGARMAQVMSTIMTVFLVVPLIAPAIGQGLIFLGHWNAPFYFLFGFGFGTIGATP